MKKIIRLTEDDLTNIVKRVVKEQTVDGVGANTLDVGSELLSLIINALPKNIIISILYDALSGNRKGIVDALNKHRTQLGNNYQSLVNAITKGDLSKFAANLKKHAIDGLSNQPNQRKDTPPTNHQSSNVGVDIEFIAD